MGSRSEAEKIGDELSEAVVRSIDLRESAAQSPLATSAAILADLSRETAGRADGQRTDTRRAVVGLLVGAVHRSLEVRAGATSRAATVRAARAALDIEAVLKAQRWTRLRLQSAGSAYAGDACHAIQQRRRAGMLVAAEVSGRAGRVGEERVACERERVVGRPCLVGPLVATAVEAVVAARWQMARDAGLDQAGAAVSAGLGGCAEGNRVRIANEVSQLLFHQIGLMAIQQKAGAATRDAEAVLGRVFPLDRPPDWISSPQRRPELPPVYRSTAVIPGAGSPPGSPEALRSKMRAELLDVEHLSGRLRPAPIRPAASLLTGTRRVPHSKVAPFSGYYQSWQYELRDSPTRFDRNRQFEHIFMAVKHCGTQSPLPAVLPPVPKWEEDGADMSMKRVAPAKRKPEWDPNQA